MTRRRFAPLTTLLLAALLAAGCGGGGGGGEPTVTQTIHDELQAELDAALATLTRERAAKAAADEARAAAVTARQAADDLRAAAETERDAAKAAQMAAEADTAEAEAAQAEAEADEAEAVAARMAAETQLATALADKEAVEADRDEKRDAATAAAVELIEVKAERDAAQRRVTELEGQLETANGRVTDLTGERDTANTEVERLEGELGTAQGEVTRLTGVIGDATDAADANGSLHAQLNAAQAEVTRLTARVGSETDASSLTGMLEAAKADVTRLTGELRTANTEVTRLTNQIGTASDPTSLQGMLEAEKLKVLRLQNQVSTLNDTVTGLRDQLADARSDVTDAERRADQAERDAERRVEQEREQAEQQVNASVRAPKWLTEFGALTDLATNGATTSVTHGRSPKVAPSGVFSRQSSAPSIAGFRGDILSRSRGSVTDTVYLYTDIQASPSSSTNRAFWKVHGESVQWDTTDALAKPTSGLPKADRSLLDPDGDGDDIATEDRPAKRSLGGTYDGVSGRFECTGTACDVSRAANDALTLDGTWTFMPRGLTDGVPQDEDLLYLYFGIWFSEPNDPSADTYDFRWIADGDGTAISDTKFQTLIGSATFTGGAVGRYSLATSADQDARVGTFTAKATLTADFDNANDGSAGNSLDGNITEFREGGRSFGSNWNVYLGTNASTAAPLTNTGVATQSGGADASIGGVEVTGGWGATLHGVDNEDLSAREDYTVTKYPMADISGVSGWFEAVDTNKGVGIVGAFGAK